MVADLNINMPDLDAKVAELTGNSLFTELLENAGQSNAGASLVSTKTNGFLGNDNLSKSRSAVLALVDKNMREEKGKLEEELLIITAVQAKEQIEEAKMNFVTSVENANEGMSGSMTTMFYDAGWNLIGESYTKEIVVDSTVIDGVMTEERRIKEFKEYDYRGDVSLSAIDPLDPENLKGKGANFIEKTITAAMKTIKNAFKVVFGEEDAESEKITKNLKDRVAGEQLSGIKGFFDGAAKSVKNLFRKKSNKDDGTVETSVTETWYQRPGAFNKHVGLSAELKTVPDMNIISDSSKWKNNFKFAGTGEMGRIMGYYLRYKLEENRGWGEMAKPAWERRIFDDDGSEWITAPSIRDVTSLAASVVITVGTAGLGSGLVPFLTGAGANLIDDLGYTIADVGVGVKSAEQGWSEFGINAASSLVTSGISMGFSGAGEASGFLSGGLTGYVSEGLTGAGKIAALTAMKGAEMFTTNMASGSISSISAGMQWDANGNYTGFDNEAYSNAFINSMVGEGAMAGYFSAMAGTLTTASMTGWNSRTVNDIALSGNIVNLEDLASLNNQAGSLVSTGVGFALTGRAQINILNLSDFTGGRYNQGLIQFGFGSGGSSLSLGGGGADFSAGSLYNSYKGINEAMKVVNKKYGSFEDQVNLEVANAEGYTSNSDNWALGRAMLEDQVGINWEDGTYTQEDGTEVNYNGLFDKDNADNITVNEVLKSLKMEDITKLAAVLSHENTHRLDYKAGRDTYEAAAHFNGMNTYNDLKNAFDLKGDSTFSMQMISALMEPGSYLANTGSADFWKLVTDEDGNSSLEYDGNADIYDEDGNFLVGAGTSPYAIQTALSKYLGVSMGEAFDSMKAAGMTADGNTWRGNALEGNMGKRIAIGGANDLNTTDYIFAAHNIGGIQNEIEQQFNASGSVDGARETLLANGWEIGRYNKGSITGRYMNLRDQAINFYLPNSGMFENGFGTRITQFSENYKNLEGNTENHRGIDIGRSKSGPTIAGQQFNSIFSGNIAWTELNTSTFYNNEASWNASRNTNLQTLENLLYHDEGGKFWKDSRKGGNTVAINQGFNFNGSFMDMGFNTRSNHFESIIANSGYLNAGSGLGYAGNTGSSTGPHVDWNVYIGLAD